MSACNGNDLCNSNGVLRSSVRLKSDTIGELSIMTILRLKGLCEETGGFWHKLQGIDKCPLGGSPSTFSGRKEI